MVGGEGKFLKNYIIWLNCPILFQRFLLSSDGGSGKFYGVSTYRNDDLDFMLLCGSVRW